MDSFLKNFKKESTLISTPDYYVYCKRIQNKPSLESWVIPHATDFIQGVRDSFQCEIGKEMADDIQIVALMAGIAADIKSVSERGYIMSFNDEPYVTPGSYTLSQSEYSGKV